MNTPRLDAGNYVITVAKCGRRPISSPVSDTILASILLGKQKPSDCGSGRRSKVYSAQFNLIQGGKIAKLRVTLHDASGSIHPYRGLGTAAID
jgi:hypothetical protein